MRRWRKRKLLSRTLGNRSSQETFRQIRGFQEDVMQMAITFMAVVGGMVFSLAVALLAEELIFGQVFRLFFSPEILARQTVVKSEQKS